MKRQILTGAIHIHTTDSDGTRSHEEVVELARQAGLSEEEATILRMAAPMHDVGKVGIPDAILNKPGKLDPHEYDLIKTHTSIGWEILRKSKRRLMRSAAIVCTVPDERKAEAVRNTVEGPVTPEVPASIMQRHADCTLCLDPAAASLLSQS